MGKFVTRNAEVSAEQWQPGKAIAGVETDEGTIKLSTAGTYFYVTKGGFRSNYWLGSEKLDGIVPEGKREGGWLQPRFVEYKLDDGTIYHREALPFAEFKVPSHGPRAPIGDDDERFKDYAALEGWEGAAGPAKQGLLRISDTKIEIVNPGDWVVTDPEGTRVMRDAEFRKQYADGPKG